MKKSVFTIFTLIYFVSIGLAQPKADALRIIVIGAHPDDCDGDGGGTAILFSTMGHKVNLFQLLMEMQDTRQRVAVH